MPMGIKKKRMRRSKSCRITGDLLKAIVLVCLVFMNCEL